MAECLTALLERGGPMTEEEEHQRMAGALLVADWMIDTKRLVLIAEALAT